MKNARRRKELLVFTGLLGSCVGVVHEGHFADLSQTGPYQYLAELDRLFRQAVPGLGNQNRELAVANALMRSAVPPAVNKWDNRSKLLFTSLVMIQLVEAGFKPPIEGIESKFYQALYDLTQTLGDVLQTTEMHKMVVFAALQLRRQNYYGK